MAADKPRLGYIGIGLMGRPMTLRLLAAGYRVTVWNRSPAKLAAAVVAASDIVFACVTDTAAVEAIVFGADGIATAPGAGKVFVDHSSIRPDRTREMAARLAAANGMA